MNELAHFSDVSCLVITKSTYINLLSTQVESNDDARAAFSHDEVAKWILGLSGSFVRGSDLFDQHEYERVQTTSIALLLGYS